MGRQDVCSFSLCFLLFFLFYEIPSSILDGLTFDNILLTEQGLRLIDVGISALKAQVGDRIYEKYLEIERDELIQFRDYFLNR